MAAGGYSVRQSPRLARTWHASGRLGDRDHVVVRLFDHRRHHPPRAAGRPAVGRRDRRVRGHRARHRHVRRAPERPTADHCRAVAIALVFQPLRQRASLLANRLVYGERATPYQVLSGFAADIAGQLDLGDALDRMVSLLGGASGASRAEAWIRVGAELRPSAVWPGGSAPSAAVPLNSASGGAAELPVLDPGARVVPVRHGDDLLGAISSSSQPPERAADRHRGQPAVGTWPRRPASAGRSPTSARSSRSRVPRGQPRAELIVRVLHRSRAEPAYRGRSPDTCWRCPWPLARHR